MDHDEFVFLFDAFDDAEPGMGMDGAMDIGGPLKREDQVYDTLGLHGIPFWVDQSPVAATSDQVLAPSSMVDAEFCIKSQESDSSFEGLDVSSWALEKQEFDDALFSPPIYVTLSPESATSAPPFSPEISRSPPSSSEEFNGASDGSVPSPAWTYDSFLEGIEYDPKLVNMFHLVTKDIANGVRPTKEQALAFVMQGPKNLVCAVDNCDWHRTGWKREDRAVSHVLKDHFRVLSYPCLDCERIYKWPHDLAKHRLHKHPNPGGKPPPQHICPESHCGQAFDKSYNLTRHRRNLHRKPVGLRRPAKARRED